MKFLGILVLLLMNSPAFSASLEVRWGKTKQVFTTEDFLKHPALTTLTVLKDPAYDHSKQTYKAVPLKVLFENHPTPRELEHSIVQFFCLDGFSAPMQASRLLSQDKNGSIAYLAIDDRPKSGPFYLIWKDPEKSQIGPEEWPFQIAAFEVKGSLAKTFPRIIPEAAFNQGFELFQKHCFACHTLNREGFSQMGPDLNVPMGPTEYFTEAGLRKLIRNPQEVRLWPQSKMRGFSKKHLSDRELDALVGYLKHMAAKR